ncbi:ArsO family NAD(P)H-dependent flavin-containing monooxygenase [Nocardioides nanhaiensis]|uniref:ArsO family NAD(P)H-dependent flavin-containing monooxygenase n=1 Tax=Nocardioides nanhaiensis TaxID=1476871 RepID=A0ABP8VP95_9ACTN
MSEDLPVVVIGGGQAGLSAGFYLQRAGLEPARDFVILDAGEEPGGAWPRMWPSLRLFSPAGYSSLPGWQMPPTQGYPSAAHVRDYLGEYEQRYRLPLVRPARVVAVRSDGEGPDRPLLVETAERTYRARAVISATGTWDRPFWPAVPGMREFAGEQLHAAQYREPGPFVDRRVLVVGGGNTAAQLLAEVSTVAETTWVTRRPPRFMADDVDGRVLFQAATRRTRAVQQGGRWDEGAEAGVGGLGDIVMVASVLEARERGVLHAEPMIERLTPEGAVWPDGTRRELDVVLWCTGFRPALAHLAPLQLRGGRHPVRTEPPGGTRSAEEPRLHLLGYGDWTGPASATLIGVGRTARDAVAEVLDDLGLA